MTLLFATFTIGFILSILALGILISFRIFGFADITAEGSLTMGAAVSAAFIASGGGTLSATILAMAAGTLAGLATGILHVKFKINALLSSILVMTSLYSINLHIMGKSNISLTDETTILSAADSIFLSLARGASEFYLFGHPVKIKIFSTLCFSLAIAAITAGLLYWFLKTEIGAALRATGDNRQMASALSINTDFMIISGLAISNALVALSGSLLAQYQGFADVQMGIGMLVWGLASVIIGEALVRERSLGLWLTSVIMGSVFFRLLVAIALRFGMNPNDMKLVTAIFVLAALILPDLLKKKFFFRSGAKNC